MASEKRQREVWLDGLKGFAIILVILGHVLSGYMDADTFPDSYNSFWYLRSWIYSFHMPLFFMVSGYAFSLAYYRTGKLDRKRWGKQVLSLIWLYFLFSLFQWLTKQVVPDEVNVTYGLADLKSILYAPMGNYWYLYVLVLYYFLTPLLRVPRQNPMWLLLYGGVALTAYRFYYYYYNLTIYRFFYHFVFFAAGCQLSTRKRLLDNPQLTGLAAMLLSAALWYFIFIWVRHWNGAWSMRIAASFCWIFLVLFYHFPKLSGLRLFQIYGKHCLEIYLLHVFLTAGLRSILPKLGIATPWLSVWVNFLISAAVCLGIAVLARKIPAADFLFRPAKAIDRIKNKNKKTD